MPDIADRHADPQLAAARFGAGGIEHAGPQHAKLELADAAFHAEQQPIVRPAGIVDPIEVDHPRVDQPAQFEQVMPIAAVAREARGVKAEHATDLSATPPDDAPIAAGSRRRAAGGTAEVVDHFDVAETPLPGDFDQLVLPPPAFEIGLNLRLSGLPDVDYRFAFENR